MTAVAQRVTVDDSRDELLVLARQIDRLVPSHRDPERFHEAKSEIAHRLRELARSRRAPA